MKKLKLDSKMPFSRWDYNEGGGSYLLGPDTVNREEISYQKFIRRLRTGYQEIFVKPWYIQMCLKHPELKDDVRFKHLMGVEYNEENVFEEMKDAELLNKRVDSIAKLLTLKATDDTFWNANFLNRKYLKFEDEDFDANEREWAMQIAKNSKASAGPEGGPESAGGAEGGATEGGAQEAPPVQEAQETPPA